MIVGDGPKHRLGAPLGERLWSVVPSLRPRQRGLLRRTAAFLLEWGIRVFESETS